MMLCMDHKNRKLHSCQYRFYVFVWKMQKVFSLKNVNKKVNKNVRKVFDEEKWNLCNFDRFIYLFKNISTIRKFTISKVIWALL